MDDELEIDEVELEGRLQEEIVSLCHRWNSSFTFHYYSYQIQ